MAAYPGLSGRSSRATLVSLGIYRRPRSALRGSDAPNSLYLLERERQTFSVCPVDENISAVTGDSDVLQTLFLAGI